MKYNIFKTLFREISSTSFVSLIGSASPFVAFFSVSAFLFLFFVCFFSIFYSTEIMYFRWFSILLAFLICVSQSESDYTITNIFERKSTKNTTIPIWIEIVEMMDKESLSLRSEYERVCMCAYNLYRNLCFEIKSNWIPYIFVKDILQTSFVAISLFLYECSILIRLVFVFYFHFSLLFSLFIWSILYCALYIAFILPLLCRYFSVFFFFFEMWTGSQC